MWFQINNINLMKHWYITSAYSKKNGTGSDFYLDSIEFFEQEGFNTFNTLKKGHMFMFFFELYLLFTMPKNVKIFTTVVGFPRQLLVLNGFSNRFRFKLFTLFKRLKKWEYYIIPIDLPLKQYDFRLSQKFISNQEAIEKILFSSCDGFLCCGSEMSKHFKNNYPSAKIVQFNMYDQILPKFNKVLEPNDNEIKKIAVIGNLSRMLGKLDLLPKHKNIQYHFLGPEGKIVDSYGRADFFYHGNLPELEFITKLSSFDFGLILYSSDVDNYFSNVIAGKFTSYVYAGLPIICFDVYTSMSELTNRLDIGVIIKDVDDIVSILNYDSNKVNEWKNNIIKEQIKIRDGQHYKKAVSEMLNKNVR